MAALPTPWNSTLRSIGRTTIIMVPRCAQCAHQSPSSLMAAALLRDGRGSRGSRGLCQGLQPARHFVLRRRCFTGFLQMVTACPHPGTKRTLDSRMRESRGAITPPMSLRLLDRYMRIVLWRYFWAIGGRPATRCEDVQISSDFIFCAPHPRATHVCSSITIPLIIIGPCREKIAAIGAAC